MNYSNQDIAIIGMAIQFPQAKTLDEFWEGLVHQKDFISDLPESRWQDIVNYCNINRIKTDFLPPAAYLEQISEFDYKYFGLSHKEACFTDPAHRMFLETAFHCLEDAGYMGEQIRNSNTGVFVGYGGDFEYTQMMRSKDRNNVFAHSIGMLSSFITSRLSYLFDLKGPAMAIDTSCSSSLCALHTACQNIRMGTCDMAIAGGVQIYSLPIESGDLGIRASSYRTRSFDESADGTGAGEGVCAILLKKAEQAFCDKDHIYAIIKGGAIGCDGSAAGITSPNMISQKEVIAAAWRDAHIEPQTVTYIEAHGTGTRIGDPIELQALTEAFSQYTNEKHFCAVSSVKSNIGHLGYCAGLAGVIKAVLQLTHNTIVPTVHYKTLNKNISLENSALYISTALKKWEEKNGIRRCGVSAFGLSGTNCHIVLEEAKACVNERTGDAAENASPYIFCLSSSWKEGLIADVNRIRSYLQGHALNLRDICYTLSTGRKHDHFRLGIICYSVEDLIYKLDLAAKTRETAIHHSIYFTAEDWLSYNYVVGNQPDYKDICMAFVSGGNIDWEKLYGCGANRVSLPGTTLHNIRCWIDFMPEEKSMVTFSEENSISALQLLVHYNRQNKTDLCQNILQILFQNYFGIQNIKINENLYDLGGDSIMALHLLKDVNTIFDLNIQPAEFLRYQSIEEIEECIHTHSGD